MAAKKLLIDAIKMTLQFLYFLYQISRVQFSRVFFNKLRKIIKARRTLNNVNFSILNKKSCYYK